MLNLVVESNRSDDMFVIKIFEPLSSISSITERDVEFFHNTWERIIPSIFTDEDRVVVRIEMFSGEDEMFVSVSEMDEIRNFVISVRITSIDEEPLIGFFIIGDGIDHVSL
jgi:hypothetical protein